MGRSRTHPCPACVTRFMLRGDVVCLACTAQVRGTRPNLLSSYARLPSNTGPEAAALRTQIIDCAKEQQPHPTQAHA